MPAGILPDRASLCLTVAIIGIPALAQNSPVCANQLPAPTISKPVIYGRTGPIPQDAAFDCLMWQTFVYLNWPVTSGQRGTPDTSAAFGSPGQTVWESYKQVVDTFPPNGQNPGSWNAAPLAPVNLKSALRREIAHGKLRVLRQTSEISQALQDSPPPQLLENGQVGGGILVDQAGNDVYYEMVLNQIEYDYIVSNGLYEATAQYACAKTRGISLPIAATSPQGSGAIEVKAAWKVLTQAELNAKPVRFHTARVLLGNATTPVTVGLVGLHIAQRAVNMYQLVWATFSQIDNAPIGSAVLTGRFSFFNPGCTTCQVNQKTNPPAPTQVVQTTSIPTPAAQVNNYMQKLIAQSNSNSPWQFYQLVNVQWPTAAVALPVPPAPASSTSPPLGSPNVTTLLSPVLETFFQGQTLSCLGCHQGATAANPQKAPNDYPSSYSFAFFHASAAAAGKSVCPAGNAGH
jgi:hypothetical protein